MHSKSLFRRSCIAILFLSALFIICTISTQAQTCRDPQILLVLTDKKGSVIDPAIIEEPKYNAKDIKSFSFFDGGNAAKPIKALEIDGSGSCSIKLDTLTVKHQGKTMRLVFNLIYYTYNPPRDRGDAKLVYKTFETIKLPPLQNGTFEYVFPDYADTILPDWKKLSDKVLTDEEIKASRPPKK